MRLPCCVVGCNEDLSRHRFPNPKTDSERMKQWVEVIGNPKLQSLNVSHIYANCRICSAHFELRYHCRNNRLSRNAIPTLNLPGLKVLEAADTNTTIQEIDISSSNTLLINTLIEEHSYADNGNSSEVEMSDQVESQSKESEHEEDNGNILEIEMLNQVKSPNKENQHEEVPANFTWRTNTTKLLIQQYNLLKNDFRNPQMKKIILWRKIQDVFKSHGYDVSTATLDSKMRTLKHHYKYLLNNNRKSATGRGRLKWEYFYDMEEALRGDKTINPPPVLSSVTIATSTVELLQSTNTSPIFRLAPIRQSPVFHSAPSPPPPERDITPAPLSPLSIYLPLPPTQTPLASPRTCTPSSINLRKRKRMSDLRTYRSKMLKMEERRVAALERLVTQMEENNQIQKEKNLLMESIFPRSRI